MFKEDTLPSRHLQTTGNHLLTSFYTRRHSVPTRPTPDPEVQLKAQKRVRSRLTDEYVRLLKENNRLREFIKRHHVRIKGQKICSHLDSLSAGKKAASLSYQMDVLESKISNIFTYF